MEIRRNILLTILFFTVLNINYCYSQIKAVNNKGEKIIVYPDGTWVYDREEEEPADSSTSKPEKASKPEKVKEAKVKPVFTRKEMISARADVTDRYRSVRIKKQSALKEKSTLSYELSTYIQGKEEEHLDIPMNTSEKATYNARLKIMKRQIKDEKKKLKKLSKEEKRYQKMLTYTGDKLMVSYQKLVAKEASLSNEGIATDEQKPKKNWNPIKILGKEKEPLSPEEAARQDYERELAEIRKKKQEELEQKIATAKLRSDKLLGYKEPEFTSRKANCEMAFDEVDPFTGKRKRATKSRELFSFVDEGYESVLKGKGYLICNGFISEINNGKEYLLVLDFVIQSKTGKEEFGGFDKGGKLAIMLIDGSMVNLKNNQSDKGQVDIGKSTTTFRGYYTLPKAELKELASTEASMMRVVWMDGFEDYEVYELDFFRDQLSCLKATK